MSAGRPLASSSDVVRPAQRRGARRCSSNALFTGNGQGVSSVTFPYPARGRFRRPERRGVLMGNWSVTGAPSLSFRGTRSTGSVTQAPRPTLAADPWEW